MPGEVDYVVTNDALHQILQLMPVMLLKTATSWVILNLHEFVYTPGAIEAFLLCADEWENPDNVSNSKLVDGDNTNLEELSNPVLATNERSTATRGQPSIAAKFPDIVNIAADFVKQHGFAAQNRRRSETGSSSGVSIQQIRENLLDKVPALREHGISLSTTRRLFHAPNKGNVASRRYKAFVDGRIGVKNNSYRKFHPDSHYLFARNKQCREFCTLFDSHSCILSMDDMAKIKVGAPAVSRYHQLRRMFSSSDMPNLTDHDFPLPSYLLSVSGYMFLQSKTGNINDDNPSSNDVAASETPHDTSLADEKIDGVMIGTVADNFWSVLIEQCKTHLNAKVGEADLKEVILTEITENKDIYHSKVDINNLSPIFENLSSVNHLDVISEAVSAQFHCDVVRLKPSGSKEIFRGRFASSLKESTLYYGFNEHDGHFYHVSFPKESVDKYKNITGLATKELKYDGLGRLHFDTPYSGPVHLMIRSHKYNSTTAASHVTDLYNILKHHKDNKSIYMFLADGGPDFNPSHLANSLFYYRLFKKLDADILDVLTYAARYSAFNPIEHCWSPASDKLASVVLSPVLDDDTVAPVLQSGLDRETLEEKEKNVFDRAINAICHQHWNGLTFDGFPVDTLPILVKEDTLLYDDYDRVKACLRCPLRSLHEFKDILDEFKEMHQHMDRHLNELVFIKCNDRSCCSKFRCEAAKDFLGKEMRFPSPSESSLYKGHYNTFLQEAINKNKRFGDAGQPNADEKALGSCQTCPFFSFKSKTERDRHQSMFHRRQNPKSKREVELVYCPVEGCGKSFKSQSSLSRHQTNQKHRARDQNKQPKKTQQTKKTQQSSITDLLRRISSQNSQDKSRVDQACASA